MAAKVYDYTAESTTIEITNIINKNCYKACDAGSPVTKTLKLYGDIKDCPCAKFDYVFNNDGSFKTGKKETDGSITLDTETDTTTVGHDYVVSVHEKFKSTDRDVPAYRTMNRKITLKAADAANSTGVWKGDSMKFNTTKKDEVVFYEKFAEAFLGELEVKIGGKIVGTDYGVTGG